MQAWINTRPRLTIELARHWQPRMCVTKSVYRVTSSPFPVTAAQFAKLDAAGLLGSGQSYTVRDGSPATFKDSVRCREFDAEGNVVADPAIDKRTGEPMPTSTADVFVYEVERLTDSGD